MRDFKKKDPNPILGKVPPQAIDLEEAVLGAIMLEKEALMLVVGILTVDTFYKDSHQVIFKAILDLFSQNDPIDLLTVTAKLRSNGELEIAGGAFYVTELTSKVSSAANIENHARIISEMFIKREIIRLASDAQKNAFDDTSDCFEVLGELENRLTNINSGITSTSIRSAYSFFEEIESDIVMAGKQPNGLTGIPSGIPSVDKLTGGWQNSDLIIIAARPSMGKSDLALNLALNASKGGYPTAVFSLEMSDKQLAKRTVAIGCRIDRGRIKDGSLTEEDWKNMTLADKKTYEGVLIGDEPGLSIYGLRAKARRLVNKYGIKMFVVDYLQLIESGIKGSTNDKVSFISRILKIIAKELNIPVIALSQLSRSVETRGGDKRPNLSDLRDSGAIEQDADVVVFVYRPIYYGITDRDDIGDTSQLMELDFAKHRNGTLDTIDCRYLGKYGKVIDFKEQDIPPGAVPINEVKWANSLPDMRERGDDF